jgi:hypothetical protein
VQALAVELAEPDAVFGVGDVEEGAAGAWTLELAEPEFVSAVLTRAPDSFALDQLMIRTRDHLLVIDRGSDGQPAD